MSTLEAEMATASGLEKELETFEQNKEKLLREGEGKYALIHGDEVAGIWDTYEDALKAGYERFELEPFLVKQIQGIERVQFIARGLPQCQS